MAIDDTRSTSGWCCGGLLATVPCDRCMGKAISSITVSVSHSISFFPLFLSQLYVGIIIHTQPFFIGGLDNPDEAKASAFGACIMFLVTFGLSVIGIFCGPKSDKEAVEAAEAPEGYVLNTGDVPEYGSQY